MTDAYASYPDKDETASLGGTSKLRASKHATANPKIDADIPPPKYQPQQQPPEPSAPLIDEPGRGPLRGIDLSKYRQPVLIEALDRLTSFSYAFSLLLGPTWKIVWRSLYYDDAHLQLQQLLGKLGGAAGINVVPPPDPNSVPPPTTPARSLSERITHFLLVGLPLALIVGVLYGVVNFITSIITDIRTIVTLSNNMFHNAVDDVRRLQKHPEQRPTKQEAIDSWVNQVATPYAHILVHKKLSYFYYFVGPLANNIVDMVIRIMARRSIDNLERIAQTTMHFTPFSAEQ